MRFAVAVAALAVIACACGPGDLCAGVKCPPKQVCDPDIGQCKPNPTLGGGAGGGGASGGGSATGGGGASTGGGSVGGGGTGGGAGTGGGGGGGTGGGAGGGAAPSNDTCAAPKLITFDGGLVDGGYVTSFYADLGAAADDYHGACSSSLGGDLVYQLSFSSPQDLIITAKGGGADPVLYLGQSPCQAADGGYSLWRDACADNTSVGETETLTLRNVLPGDYFLFVDSYSPSMSGAPLVTVRASASVALVPGDLCTAPLPLFADGGSHDTVTATTFGAADDSTSSCSANAGTDGGDVYFGFTTTSARRFSATATPPLTWDGGLRPELYLSPLAGCSTGVLLPSSPRLGCSVAAAPEHAGELAVDSLPAGDWLLTVDSHRDYYQGQATWGSFTLDATLSAPAGAPANDDCGSAAQLTLGAGPYPGTSAVAVVASTLSGAANNQQFLCGGLIQSGPDVAYRLTTPASAGGDGGVYVKATVSSGDFLKLLPSVFLQRVCGTDAGMSCSLAAGSVSQTSNTAAAYLVAPVNTPVTAWVDTASGAGGPFSLKLETATQPANDRCSGAITLPLNTSLAGTTLGAVNDYDSNGVINTQGANNCYDGLYGADVVYAFTAPSTGDYTLRMQPEPLFNAALGVVTDCLSANSCVTTQDDMPDSWEEVITFTASQGVTYFVIADGYTDDLTQPGARGGFILSISQ